MPPWVALQCHAWRCSRALTSSLRCAQYIQRIQPSRDLRFYSSSHHDPRLPLGSANSAIIIPSSAAKTRPEDLIAHIKPVDSQHLSHDQFAVFFLTPSFATWLLNDGTFLQKALSRLYAPLLEQNQGQGQIHALCAVVDKLPTPRPIVDSENIENASLKRTVQPPVLEIGHEGIAYAALQSSDSIPASPGTNYEQAAISFIASQGSAPEDLRGDALRLPIANTVFQTGSPSTMTYSIWEKATGSQEIKLQHKQDANHHGIKIQQASSADNYTSALSVPLVPLTMPREIEASMGNILRRLIGDNGASITASQELEKVVPQYFTSRGEPSQATTVWALVIRRDTLDSVMAKTTSLLVGSTTPDNSAWERLWKQNPAVWSDLVPAALASGARLHRVLSGGGGWGKKAGLLSLDPLPAAETDDLFEHSDELDFDYAPDTLSSVLQQVASDGDYIQFLISPSNAAKEQQTLEGLEDASSVWGWELGTIPSTTDSMPVLPGQEVESTPNEISVFRGTFGALAEGGMVIRRNFKLKTENSVSLIGGSTIDVPFSRFSAVSWRPNVKGTGKDSVQFPTSFKTLNSIAGHPVPIGKFQQAGFHSASTLAEEHPDTKKPKTKKPSSPRKPGALIRYDKIRPPPEIVIYSIKTLASICREVGSLTSKYRTLMHQLRKKNNLRMDAALVKPKPKPQHPANLAAGLNPLELGDSTRTYDGLSRLLMQPWAQKRSFPPPDLNSVLDATIFNQAPPSSPTALLAHASTLLATCQRQLSLYRTIFRATITTAVLDIYTEEIIRGVSHNHVRLWQCLSDMTAVRSQDPSSKAVLTERLDRLGRVGNDRPLIIRKKFSEDQYKTARDRREIGPSVRTVVMEKKRTPHNGQKRPSPESFSAREQLSVEVTKKKQGKVLFEKLVRGWLTG